MELVLLFIFLLLLPIFVLLRGRKQPPGPPALPLLGSLPFLDISKGVSGWTLDPQITAHRIAVITFGTKVFHVVNDFQLCKDLFEREEFSGRPRDKFLLKHRFNHPVPLGIIHTEGLHWSTQRRFSLKTLKDFGFGRKSIEESIHFEVDEMIDSTFSQTCDIHLRNDFNIPIINVLWQMVANKRFSSAKSEDVELIEGVSYMFENGRKRDLMPAFVQNLIPASFHEYTLTGKRIRVMAGIRRHLVKEVEEHSTDFDSGNPKDFIDVYLASIGKDTGQDLNMLDLTDCIWDFFMAGTETSSTTLKWIILYLVIHQNVQDRCRAELRSVLGSRKASVADMPQLPFLQATIAEVQRIAYIAPMSLPHRTTRPTEVDGYRFPENTIFMANISFMMNDPEYFDRPQEFNPDRFMTSDGRYVKNERLVPFGIGKRYCMGELLARNEVFLFTSDLLQRIKLLPPTSNPIPDPNKFLCNFTRIANDFHVRVEKL